MQPLKLLHARKYQYVVQVFYHHKVIIALMMEKHQEQYHRTIRLVLSLKGIACPEACP